VTTEKCDDVPVNQKEIFKMTVHNDGDVAFIINEIKSTSPVFTLVKPPNGDKIPALGELSFDVQFSPTQAKKYTTEISVNSTASSGVSSVSVSASGTSSNIVTIPNLETFTGCDDQDSVRDLTSVVRGLYDVYWTNEFKLSVKSIDSANSKVTFVIKRCDDLNMQKDYTVHIYDMNPNVQSPYWSSVTSSYTGDPEIEIVHPVKFIGHDTKKFIATIYYAGLQSENWCTKEVEIKW